MIGFLETIEHRTGKVMGLILVMIPYEEGVTSRDSRPTLGKGTATRELIEEILFIKSMSKSLMRSIRNRTIPCFYTPMCRLLLAVPAERGVRDAYETGNNVDTYGNRR